MSSKQILNYNIGKEVGKGTFGKVYVGLNNDNNERVAVKEVKNEQRFKDAAIKEIKILKQLKENKLEETYVIDFKDNFVFLGIQYLVFEYMDKNLYYYYKKNTISYKNVISIFYEVTKGLEYIHSQNIIHCDLKPENIMINKETKKIKIIDFGSAIYYGTEKKHFYIQSRYYRAPEIVYCISQYTCAIDIWSLGCIIYELLFRKPLFPATDKKDLLFLFTTLLGIPNDGAYFISPEYNQHFVFSIGCNQYMRRHTKKVYETVDKEGLLFKLNNEIDIKLEYKEDLMELLQSIITYDYKNRITATKILENGLFYRK